LGSFKGSFNQKLTGWSTLVHSAAAPPQMREKPLLKKKIKGRTTQLSQLRQIFEEKISDPSGHFFGNIGTVSTWMVLCSAYLQGKLISCWPPVLYHIVRN
jgi:hypothetical protein